MFRNSVVIQIGSHIGNTINDPIFKEVDETTRLILVEPVPYLFDQLKKNYEKKNINNNIIFINKAVSNYIGYIELTIPSQKNDFSKFPNWASQLASTNENHCKMHLPDLITEKINVKTTTINEIIKEYNIKEIGILHTDTEGHDYDILMNYDFTIKPKYVLFEHKHMDGIFTVGKKYEQLKKFLEKHGYKYNNSDSEDTIFELQK